MYSSAFLSSTREGGGVEGIEQYQKMSDFGFSLLKGKIEPLGAVLLPRGRISDKPVGKGMDILGIRPRGER